jgi:hypothetical protein
MSRSLPGQKRSIQDEGISHGGFWVRAYSRTKKKRNHTLSREQGTRKENGKKKDMSMEKKPINFSFAVGAVFFCWKMKEMIIIMKEIHDIL